MKSVRKLLALFLGLAVFSIAYGEEVRVEEEVNAFDFSNEAGVVFSLGNPMCYGAIDYLHYFNDVFSLGGQFFASYGKNYDSIDEDDEKEYLIIANLETDLTVYRSVMNKNFASSFYLWLLAGYEAKKQWYYTAESSYYETNSYVIGGLGIGYDLIAFNHFVFPIRIGFEGCCLPDVEIGFVFSGGLNYRF